MNQVFPGAAILEPAMTPEPAGFRGAQMFPDTGTRWLNSVRVGFESAWKDFPTERPGDPRGCLSSRLLFLPSRTLQGE